MERIFILEPNHQTAESLSRYLKKEGYEVQWMDRIESCLTEIQKYPPDLILSELQLPESGLKHLCQRIGKTEKLTNIPLIITTNFTINDQLHQVISAFGAHGLIQKPFSFPLLLKEIQSVLNRIHLKEKVIPDTLPAKCKPEGVLNSFIVPSLFSSIVNQKKTLCFTLENNGSVCRLYFEKGQLIGFTQNFSFEKNLAKTLLENAQISQEMYESVLAWLKKSQPSMDLDPTHPQNHKLHDELQQVLLHWKILSPHQLYQSLHAQISTQFIDLWGWRQGRYALCNEAMERPDPLVQSLNLPMLVFQSIKKYGSVSKMSSRFIFWDQAERKAKEDYFTTLGDMPLSESERQFISMFSRGAKISQAIAQSKIEMNQACVLLACLEFFGMIAISSQSSLQSAISRISGLRSRAGQFEKTLSSPSKDLGKVEKSSNASSIKEEPSDQKRTTLPLSKALSFKGVTLSPSFKGITSPLPRPFAEAQQTLSMPKNTSTSQERASLPRSNALQDAINTDIDMENRSNDKLSTPTDKGILPKPPHKPRPLMKVGMRLGPYCLQERVGEGAMAEVFRAYDDALDRIVAIKIISPKLAITDMLLERFFREATALARFNCSQIPQIYFIDKKSEIPFFAMEFIEGKNLQQILDQQHKIELRQSVEIIHEVCKGLQVAHQNGIIHRDIKPLNIMFTIQGKVKITDFGLAKSAAWAKNLTVSHSLIGSPMYISPEQITLGKTDHRSDIYALGITMYQMLVGEFPFPSTKLYELLSHHKKTPIPISDKRDALLPSPLCDIIEKMAAKQPEERYQSYEDLIHDLQKFAI